MRIRWYIQDTGVKDASRIVDVEFEPRQHNIETRTTLRPIPIECDGEHVGYVAHGTSTKHVRAVLHQSFPFEYISTLTEGEYVGDVLIVRSSDALRNVVRKARRGIA